MQDFLSSFDQRSSSQKFLIVVGVTLLLLGFIGISFFLTTPKSNNLATPSPSPAVNQENSLFLPASDQDTQLNHTYAGNHFAITFRTDLYQATGNRDNGADRIVLRHESQHPGDVAYTVDIHIEPSEKLDYARLLRIFDGYKFLRTQVLLDGESAIRYKGSIVGKNSVNHNIVYILSKEGLTFKFQLGYQSGRDEEKIEEEFESLMRTIKLN